jgi:tetratricopeptide (TPR) repeat protein
LNAAYPREEDYRLHWAGTHNDLAVLFLGQQHYPEAEKELRQAIAIQNQLLADFPDSPQRDRHRQRLALSYVNLGSALAHAGDPDAIRAAEQAFAQGLALAEELARTSSDPTVRREAWHVQAMVWVNRGSRLHLLKQWPQAVDAYRQAVALYVRLRADSPSNMELEQEYATTENNLGMTYREMKRLPEALACHRQALGVFEKLFAALPSSVANRAGLAGAAHALAVALDDSGELAEAEQAYRRAYELRAQLPQTAAVADMRYRGHRARARTLV